MKKLFLLLLMLVLATFVFFGCQGLVPSEGEGEGEEEVVTEGITVDIEGSINIDNKTYLSRGVHEITITFPTPVTGLVKGYITYCTGDYSKDKDSGTEVILFPNEDKTVWTGSGSFQDSMSLCCASYLQITSGECEDEICINMPIIVDSEPPYATIEVCTDSCTCDGCELSFTSTTTSIDCADDTADCGDDCSGMANWSIVLYEEYPFDECCDASCEEPIFVCSGTDCPIECTTDCLTEGTYYAIITLIDHVGNEVSFASQIDWDSENCNTIRLTDLDPSACLDNSINSGLVICEGLEAFELTMTADPSEGGTATDMTGEGPYYMEGEVVDVSVTPATGYEFVNWTAPTGTFADANSATTTFTVPAKDVTVTANFELIDYNVSLSVDPVNSGTTTGSGIYNMGDPVTLTATPEDGYTFVNWTDDDDGDSIVSTNTTYNFTMPASNVNYTANFEISRYTLSMSEDPTAGGTATDETGNSPYTEGTSVSILATPASGYEFLYWTTPGGTYDANFDDANNPSTTFNMPAENITVTARFLDILERSYTYTWLCDNNNWYPVTPISGGGTGITVDTWDISSIATGSEIDFKFDAYSVPDRWFIYYNGSLVHQTGWRGDSSYAGVLYPGGITEPGSGEVLAVITKLDGVNTLEIRSEGAESGTAWLYQLRSNCLP